MKLFYSSTSPYVRKCLVVAHELGLADRIETAPVTTMPTAHNAELMQKNPLCKLPTLLADDGTVLYDSRVIVEYLNALADGSLVPAGAARWTALVGQALADGILDAALLMRYEVVLRPEEHRSAAWTETQREKISSALKQAESAADTLRDRIDIGTIALATALSYLDLRFADLGWRTNHPALAAWYATFSERPSMQATALKG